VYVLKSHTKSDLEAMLKQALKKDEFLSEMDISIETPEALIKYSGGDGRKLLNLLELCVQQGKLPLKINEDYIKTVVQNNPLMYDKDGEQHYDIISAFIKSMRGSDPQAAVYWLARMIEGGEDPKFIA